MDGRTVICIVGPTAVGKSSVAQEVACTLGGEVVSVDSMQVYRGMDIGTAKTPPAERTCPLHMVDVAEVGDSYSVACFQRDARACVDALLERRACAVLCGGTGLSLDAVIERRVDRMFELGLVDEVRELCNKGLRESPTAAKAIGYKEVLSALDGTISMEEARELVKRNTRRYAKRQLSWLKRDGRARWLHMDEMSIDDAVKTICEDWRACGS
ncbi:MAG: tRNA (adenosine(37)-N6)-dimethylallyltransferase MiaA [Atopobiaceae bacterium]|nr:tRNA (adenosine(37)-N6)-dimethylallyltransferase MiaA [Atopobiaceae bacterium]